MTAQTNPVRPRRTGGKVRKFGRPLAPGVTLNDLVFPPSAGSSMRFTLNTAVVAVGAELPLHSHDQREVWVIMSGHGVLDRGEETFEIATGDVLLFEPNVEHHLSNVGAEELHLVSIYWDER